MLSLLLKFAWELLSGDVYRLWTAHKAKEALNAQNDVASLNDSSVDSKLREWESRN